MIRKLGLWSLTGVLAALSAFQANAAKFVWVGEEGDWSDVTKWHQGTDAGATGVLPGVDDTVQLSGAKAKINVDGDYHVKDLYPYAWGTAIVYTFVGNGKLTVGSGGVNTSFNTYNCNYILDGPDLYCQEGVQYIQGGSLTVRKGVFTVKQVYHQYAGGKLIIDGGILSSGGDDQRWINLQNDWSATGDPVATLELRSGVLEARVDFNVGYFTVTGGTWDRTVHQTRTFADLFSRENLIVDIQRGDKLVLRSTDTVLNDNMYKFRNVDGTAVNQSLGTAVVNEKFPDGMDVGDYRIPRLTMTVTNNLVVNGEVLDFYNFNIVTGVHEAVVNVSTVKVHQSGGVDIAPPEASIANKAGVAPLYIHSYKPITFASECADNLKVFIWGGLSDNYWYFHKGLTCNTSSDKGTGYTQYIYCPIFGEGSDLNVEGNGTAQIGFSTRDAEPKHGRALSNRLERVSVTGGSRLTLQNFAWSNYYYPFHADRFTLGADSRFETLFTTYSRTEFDIVDLDPAGTLVLRVLASTDSNYAASKFPAMLNFGPQHVNDFQTDATRPKLEMVLQGAKDGELPEDHWQCAWINGIPTVWNKDDPYLTVGGCDGAPYWRGTVDGDWSNGANWTTGKAPSGNTQTAEAKAVFGGGYANTRITVDDEVEVFQIRVSENTAPLAFVGKGTIRIASTVATSSGGSSGWTCNAAISSGSLNPIIFDVPVVHTGTDNYYYSSVNASGRGYIAFNKETTFGRPTFIGDVRVAGTLNVMDLLLAEAAGRPAPPTRLSVFPGGTVNVTNQTWVGSGTDVSIIVYSNATVNITKTGPANFWGQNVNRTPIWVKKHGVFNCRIPLGGKGDCTKVAFRGEGVVKLADTGSKAEVPHTVEIDGNTFAIDAFTPGCPLVLKGSPTWGAAVDWTYDLDPITLPAGETLTIDTDDIDGNGVHTVTLAAKVTADNLVVKGAGTLKFAVPQNVGAISFAEGTKLAIDDGILVSGAWTTVLTLPKDATVDVDDLPFDSGKVKVRVVETDKAVLVQAKPKSGALIIIR